MRAGYKVAAAGLAVVLGCGLVAFTPQTGTSSNALLGLSSGATASASSVDAVYRDGEYRASAQGKLGRVPVTVTVEDGMVTDVVVGQNSEVGAMLDKAVATVVPQILEKQSAEDIDVATGATLTSNAIVEAVSCALARAAA